MSELQTVIAPINYLPRGTETPEVRNREYGQDALRNYNYQTLPTVIHDGRVDETVYRLDVHGFQFVREPSILPAHLRDTDPVIERDYYPETKAILKGATGAQDVIIFDHTVRTEDLYATRRPVRGAHNDYTENSGPQRLRDLLGEDEANKRLAEGRVAQINLWRPIGAPVYSSPLAIADARSVKPEDLRHTALIYPDRQGETFDLQYHPDQHWVTFSAMTPDEAILIKGYDSAEDGRARFTPHTGFDDPRTPSGAPPRRSIEIRSFVFFRNNN